MIAWLITGTRNLDDAGRAKVRETLRQEAKTHGYPDLVVHGACRGVDRFVGSLCRQRGGIVVMEMPANWEKYGKRAGPKRNKEMILYLLGLQDEGETVRYLAFPRGESKGTWGCVELCEEAGLEGRVVELEVGHGS